MTKGKNKKMKITKIYLVFAAAPSRSQDSGEGGGGVVVSWQNSHLAKSSSVQVE